MSVYVPTAFEELVEYLARYATPEQILDFRPSEEAQTRATELLERNSDGTLTPDEYRELQQMLYFDRIVSALKAKALAFPAL